jgi:hypothetical protein
MARIDWGRVGGTVAQMIQPAPLMYPGGRSIQEERFGPTGNLARRQLTNIYPPTIVPQKSPLGTFALIALVGWAVLNPQGVSSDIQAIRAAFTAPTQPLARTAAGRALQPTQGG